MTGNKMAPSSWQTTSPSGPILVASDRPAAHVPPAADPTIARPASDFPPLTVSRLSIPGRFRRCFPEIRSSTAARPSVKPTAVDLADWRQGRVVIGDRGGWGSILRPTPAPAGFRGSFRPGGGKSMECLSTSLSR